jgi:kynurenine formamidase
VIDLSHPVAAGMPVHPGDPGVVFEPALTIARDGAAVTAVSLGSHTGTHVDAPAHAIPGGRTIDRVGLDELAGEALILHVADRVSDGLGIDGAALGLDLLGSVPRLVAIRTGWDRHFGTERYLRHPYLIASAARRLMELGMRVLAVDTPSPDPTPSGGEPPVLAVHEAVLGGDGLIVENLRGLDRLGRRARLGVFPLPLVGADGAPARVVAWEGASCAPGLNFCGCR